jgi:hypothetical protein
MSGRRQSTQIIGASADAIDLARGVGRLLGDMGYSALPEFRLNSGRRVDVIGVDAKGRIAIVEIKCSVADFRADRKWPEYLDFCDHFYFAVQLGFPYDVLPSDTGLIVADAYGGEVVRTAPARAINGNRRRSLTLSLARTAATRLSAFWDEGPKPGAARPRPRPRQR